MINLIVTFSMILSLFGGSYSEESGKIGQLDFKYVRLCENSPETDLKLNLDLQKSDDGDALKVDLDLPFNVTSDVCEMRLVVDKYHEDEDNWETFYELNDELTEIMMRQVILWSTIHSMIEPPLSRHYSIPKGEYTATIRGIRPNIVTNNIPYGELRASFNFKCNNEWVACIETEFDSIKP